MQTLTLILLSISSLIYVTKSIIQYFRDKNERLLIKTDISIYKNNIYKVTNELKKIIKDVEYISIHKRSMTNIVMPDKKDIYNTKTLYNLFYQKYYNHYDLIADLTLLYHNALKLELAIDYIEKFINDYNVSSKSIVNMYNLTNAEYNINNLY